MATDETKPLLIKVNPSWSRRSNLRSGAVPPRGYSRTSSNVQASSGDDLVRITSAINGDASDKWKINIALALILASVVLERMVFYGFVGNLIMFLNIIPFNWNIFFAVCAMFLFFGVSYVMSVIGGWISDSFFGRFKTIIISYVIYLCGYILLPFLALNTDLTEQNITDLNVSLPGICMSSVGNSSNVSLFDEPCSWLITVTLVVIAISSGMLKANICPFGSDQLVRANQETKLSFFNWFYWCINIGSFLGLGVIAYVEQQVTFFHGFLVCTIALGVSAVIFIVGYPFYICRPPDGSILTNIFKIIRDACRNKREHNKQKERLKISNANRSAVNVDDAGQEEKKIPLLDYAKQSHGGSFHNSFVDDVKKLGMILAVFAVLTPYWLVYFQMQTTFMFQGLNMRLSFNVPVVNSTIVKNDNSNTPEIAVAWFSLCDALFVIILLPLFDRIIYPRMAKAGYHFTFGKRIVLGMLFATASMVAAGLVEHFRWEALEPDLNKTCITSSIRQKIGNTIFNASNISVLWQIPQYALIGISEVFASVACLQFAVMVAPKSMKAAITGLYYFFCGIGSFLGSALVVILTNLDIWLPSRHGYSNMNCWLPCSPNSSGQMPKCHFDYYFYFLAGCEGVGLLLFIVVARVYELNIDELTFHARLKNEEAVNEGNGGNGGRGSNEGNGGRATIEGNNSNEGKGSNGIRESRRIPSRTYRS